MLKTISLSILGILLPGLTLSRVAVADTARMEGIAMQLGIDASSSTVASKEAAAAVDRLVAVGLSSYPTLKERGAELAQRRAEKEAAQAAFQPKLSIAANVSRQDAKDVDTEGRNTTDGRDASLLLRQNLWRGGQDRGQIAISEQSEALADLSQQYERASLSFAIRKSALDYNYRSLRQVIDEVSWADASELRALANRKLDAGQVGKIDIYTTTMRESAAKAAATRAALETRQAHQRLLAYLGPQANVATLDADIKLLTGRTLPYPDRMPILADGQPATFEERNAAVVVKRADITLVQGYRQRFLPQVDLVGQLSRSKNKSNYDLNDSVTTRSNTSGTFVQLQFNWMLYDRSADFLNHAAAEQKNLAGAQGETARYRTETEALRIKTYVLDLYNNLATAIEAYKASGQLYDAQRKLYETGVIGIQTLIDAEAEKRSAIGVWHQNVYELQLNLLAWDALQEGFLSN